MKHQMSEFEKRMKEKEKRESREKREKEASEKLHARFTEGIEVNDSVADDFQDVEDKPFRAEAPEKCFFCGSTPADMRKETGVPWVTLGVPDTLIIFYQCTVCNTLMGNIHVVENTKRVQQEIAEKRGKKIQLPQSPLVLMPHDPSSKPH